MRPTLRAARRLRLTALPALGILGIAIAQGSAEAELPLHGPAPLDRYSGVSSISATMASGTTSFAAAAPVLAGKAGSPETGFLGSALDALDRGNTSEARRLRDAMPEGSLDRHIAQWAIALSGRRDVPASDIARAMNELSGWPGMGTMAERYETALVREGNAIALERDFREHAPRTIEARLALIEAVAASDPQRAANVLRPIWHREPLDAGVETDVLARFGNLLTEADHRRRVASMVYRDRIRAAERIASRAGPDAAILVRAAGAVARKRGAAGALEAVPDAVRSDPIYLYARARFLMRQDRQREAAATLNAHTIGEAAAVDTRAWWNLREDLTRQLLRQGDARLAYDVASGHSAGRASDIIAAEFLAGWIALRELGDAAAARDHFAEALSNSTRSLSVSRGAYWLGRAEESLGNGAAAQEAYGRAAMLPTTFYGQLAAEKVGRAPGSFAYPSPTTEDRAAFNSNPLVEAIKRIEATNQVSRARLIYRHLARTLPTAQQVALLTARAEDRGQFQLSLQIGKSALARGLPAEALAFPTGAIPSDAPLSGAGRSLAYAIARQESAFDREAKSPVGARGLLQLMPATAREVAGWMNLPYSTSRLTSDPSYNAALGARFLSRLLDRFDQSYVLAAVAYNAGPTRAINWRQRNGDPVGANVEDVVDWIERIPFDETRNYVQRVMENYQVYRLRLDNRPPALSRDLTEGRTN